MGERVWGGGSESSRCLFCQRQRPPIEPLHFPALSSPSDQRAVLHMKGTAHHAVHISPALASQLSKQRASHLFRQSLTFSGVGLLRLLFLNSLSRAIQALAVQLGRGRRGRSPSSSDQSAQVIFKHLEDSWLLLLPPHLAIQAVGASFLSSFIFSIPSNSLKFLFLLYLKGDYSLRIVWAGLSKQDGDENTAPLFSCE